jgi:hypothetical protein
MQDSVGKILMDKLRKTLLPDFTNKLTWLLGSAGVTLIVGPAMFRLVGRISADVYGVPLEVEFFSDDRSGYGVLLCLLAVIQNIGYQVKGGLSEAYAIKELDRKHELEMQEARHSHELLMENAESDRGISGSKREHDLARIYDLVKIFPFEDSCDALVIAAQTGISDAFQESLEELSNLHHVSQKLYDTEAEGARKTLVIQAKETQSVLSSYLTLDSRFEGRYVPIFEMKHNGMRHEYYRRQNEMYLSCIALIRSYEHFVEVLRKKALWGANA